MSFIHGFQKSAAERQTGDHRLRRFVLSNGVSAAISAPQGKKLQALREGTAHDLRQTGSHAARGALGTALAGVPVGALAAVARAKRHKIPVTGRAIAQGIGFGAGLGGVAGASLGAGTGHLKGTFDCKATAIHRKYEK